MEPRETAGLETPTLFKSGLSADAAAGPATKAAAITPKFFKNPLRSIGA